MSRKRKTANRRTSAKPKSPLESIKTESTSPMTLKACALAATGEELRLIMSQVLISQTHMVTYIKNSGIAKEISFQDKIVERKKCAGILETIEEMIRIDSELNAMALYQKDVGTREYSTYSHSITNSSASTCSRE